MDALRTHMRAGHRRLVLIIPTGGGKTLVACQIMQQAAAKNKRILFLAHRFELIDQCSRKLSEFGLWQHGIIKANMDANPGAAIQVASIMSIIRRPLLIGGYDLIIIDETHRALEDNSYGKVLKANPNAFVIGLTATAFRTDGKPLGSVFQEAVVAADINQLIAQGYLVPPRVLAGHKVDLRGVRIRAGDYVTEELSEAVMKPGLIAAIVKSYLKHASDRLTFCYASSIDHSRAIVEALRAAGVAAEHLDGETPADVRAAALVRFRARITMVISNVGLYTEGTDVPEASCIIDANPTKSRGKWKQKNGRALRPFPGKTDALILDHANAYLLHGWLTDHDEVDLKTGLKDKPRPDKQCSACKAKLRGVPKFCPSCGVQLRDEADAVKPKAVLDLGAGGYDMREISQQDAKRRAIASHADQMFFNDVRTALEKGYKVGWAAYRYKMRTGGRWPSRELLERAKGMAV